MTPVGTPPEHDLFAQLTTLQDSVQRWAGGMTTTSAE
jgi:hypothetical protein